MSQIIRKIIQQYYSIQDLRVVSYQRIVNFLKLYRDDILNNLRKSQMGLEIQKNGASRMTNESQPKNASQMKIETHVRNASQKDNETHKQIASQEKIETPPIDASQRADETYICIAMQLLEKRKYSEFAKKFLIKSQINGETYISSASHILKAVLNVSEDIEILIEVHNRLHEIEKWLYKKLDVWSEDHPLRKNYLNKVKGIGAVLSSGIIAYLSQPILKAQHVSQIWSYCGLAPKQVGMQRKGTKLNYDPFLKSFVVFRLGRSLLMFNKFAKKLYDEFKEDAKRKHPDWTKLHLHNHARRKVVKLFIASVWEVWRRMNNLPVTEPYPIAVLGHETKITPLDWISK